GDVVEAARTTMGSIELDPASCALANTVVKADRFFEKRDNGLKQPWNVRTVWLNPPGGIAPANGISRSLPVLWWAKLQLELARGNVSECAIYLAFSIEFFQNVQVSNGNFPKNPARDNAFCI